MEMVLFFVGLGFFLFVFFLIQREEDKRYQRRLDEMREFGYRPKLYNPEETPEDKK